MSRLVTVTLALLLAGCGSAQANRPTSTLHRGGVMEVAIGNPMVNDTRTTVTVSPLVPKPRVDGSRAEFVYLGLLGPDPVGRNTIRVRYAEHVIANDVENERPEYRAEVTLDLGQSRTLEFKGWRIEVLEASAAAIRFEVVGTPAP
jgi:hypothetical protein